MKEEKTDIKWGNHKIINVPVLIDEFGERYFKGSVSLKLSMIAEHMGENELAEYNFDDFKVEV